MSEKHLPTQLQDYIHKSRYARWLDDQNRRETWPETVDRYVDYFGNKFPEHYPKDFIRSSILNLEAMPSMRALMTAGPALERDPIAGFNCAFTAIDNIHAFDEILYILMCGTGMGFSVERQYINNLPVVGASIGFKTDGTPVVMVADKLEPENYTITVGDSKRGWATALATLIQHLYAGKIPSWDVTQVRLAGEKLKTFGGRASGPEPLVDLFKYAINIFKGAVGRKLNSVECHDLVCKIAEIVVVGGVRRSALISLSNLSDDRMRGAKSGQWWVNDPQRALANNSAAYTDRPSAEVFIKEWASLIESKSGERGIFNLEAAKQKAIAVGRRDPSKIKGTNPCAEISLRSKGLCNLTEVVLRFDDTLESIMKKIEAAVIMGTYQSMLQDFRYISKEWIENQKEERLLGVSLTGIMDHPVLNRNCQEARDMLNRMREYAIEVNKIWAEKLGINQSVAITTVKPSGTVSQLVDAASGIHPRYSEYYIRTVRADKKDPLAQFMRKQGFPVEDAFGKEDSTDVFSFPVKGPSHAVFRNDRTAIEQLEQYLMVQDCWSEHNVSNTIYVKDSEWMAVGAWVYEHFDKLAGVSFLPHSDHSYRQAPYQECTEQEYNELLAKMPEFNWELLSEFEKEDNTTGVKEFACTGGACELI